MDSRLYQASVKGDVDTLCNLIHENPLILEKATVGRLNQNPLHIAASVGHLEFTRALLSLNTNLATKPDSRGRCPLHLASENGHVEIVRELLLHANDAVCQVDEEGRIPLHLAAMQGHVNVIIELIGARPESIYMVTKEMDLVKEMELMAARPESTMVTNKETALHLCVRYNRLEALKLLLDLAPSDSLVSARDKDGNTVLHLAAALQNTEIIKYLISLPDVKGLLAKMLNERNFTALDVIEHSTITDASIEIQDILNQAGVRPELPKFAKFLRKYLTMDDSWFKDSRGHLITTSTVIATVAFQAGVTPPGGVWQDDVKGSNTTQGHEAGTSITATKSSSLHTKYVLYNTFSFATSLIVILLLISGVAFKNNVLMGILNIAMFYSIILMALAYSVSVQMMIPGTDSSRTFVMVICYGAAYICYAVLLFVMIPYAFYILKGKDDKYYISKLVKWLKGRDVNISKWVEWVDRYFYISKWVKWVKSKLKGKDKNKPDGSSASHDQSAA